MIQLTKLAAEKIKEFKKQDNIQQEYLRVRIVAGGCSGFRYDLFFDSSASELDEIVEQDGIKMVIDPISFQYVDGMTIDYRESLAEAGFLFCNPQIKSTCGCGSSVGF
jgi:iron-sulfur cluster insertion protein